MEGIRVEASSDYFIRNSQRNEIIWAKCQSVIEKITIQLLAFNNEEWRWKQTVHRFLV